MTPVDHMTFLDFPPETSKKASKSANLTNINPSAAPVTSPADRILNRVPPKIEALKSSEVLSRVAAFLPQLAASNRAILQKRPEDVNIEVLNEAADQVIEMKLGLGVFEEKRSEGEDSSEDSDNDQVGGQKKIFVLPSELRAAASAAASSGNNGKMDPFERVINSLLLFDSSTDDDEEMSEATESSEASETNVLEFE